LPPERRSRRKKMKGLLILKKGEKLEVLQEESIE
jgi:hypothetical protein